MERFKELVSEASGYSAARVPAEPELLLCQKPLTQGAWSTAGPGQSPLSSLHDML